MRVQIYKPLNVYKFVGMRVQIYKPLNVYKFVGMRVQIMKELHSWQKISGPDPNNNDICFSGVGRYCL
jgi:hypothetical protein